MASLKYFLLSPFIFLSLTSTIANRVPTYQDESSFRFRLSSESRVEGGVSGIVAGLRAGLGVHGGLSNIVANPKVGFGLDLSLGGVNNVAVGLRAGLGVEGGLNVGVASKVGLRPGSGVSNVEPRTEGGSVRRGNGIRSEFGAKINWAKSKHIASAQHGISENAQPTKQAQTGV